MFRKMRRIRQQISQAECVEILNRATSGVLGLHGDDGYPYTVPVSFVYQEGGTGLGIIGFHCAKTGHKIDTIRRNNKVSFTSETIAIISSEDVEKHRGELMASGYIVDLEEVNVCPARQ